MARLQRRRCLSGVVLGLLFAARCAAQDDNESDAGAGSGSEEGSGGNSNLANLVTRSGSTYKCHESLGSDYEYNISLLSPTTFRLLINDDVLQLSQQFHPIKCVTADEKEAPGRILVIGDACWLNNPDIESCYRQENFKYPVQPNAKVLKIALSVKEDGSGYDLDNFGPSRFQKFRESQIPNKVGLEVCAVLGNCVPNQGLCVPVFTMVAEDWSKTYSQAKYANIWKDWDFNPVESFELAEGLWEQPHAIPAYGPYPHCPEDELGRAKPCSEDELLMIWVKSFKLRRAEIIDPGTIAFRVNFELQWGDRYAVHPCTINLFNIVTGGKPYKIPSELFWAPGLNITNAAKDSRAISSSSVLNVLFGFDDPVRDKAGDDINWPKQLYLGRKYDSEYYPSVTLDWDKYPFDEQTLQLVLTDTTVEAWQLNFSLASTKLDTSDVNVGDGWTLKSVTMDMTPGNDGTNGTEERPTVRITVKVKRNPRGKVYSVILPAFAVAALDIAFHMVARYGDVAGTFMTAAVICSVGLAMIDPGFLGFPANIASMPFIQCFCLMILIGGLKTSLLVLGRAFWAVRMHYTREEMEDLEHRAHHNKLFKQVRPEGELNEKKSQHEQLFEYHSMLESQLERYDLFIKASVPIWYLAAWLIVAAAYGVL